MKKLIWRCTKLKKLILLLSILSLFGCFGGYEDPKKVGIIEGYVIDVLNGDTLSNTVVKLQDVSYTTAEDGYFPLVRSGEDPYIIPKDSGDSYRILCNREDDGGLTNGTIAADNWVRWHTTSISSPGFLTVTINYTID